MKTKCNLCQLAENPTCAFECGRFTADNHSCQTMLYLREYAKERNHYVYKDDQYTAILRGVDNVAVIISWYKERGRTELAVSLDLDNNFKLLTVGEADEMVRLGRMNLL